MVSIGIFLASAVAIGVIFVVLRSLRSEGRSTYIGARHGNDMVDWTLEWRRALKSLESQGPASGRSARRS